MTGEGSSEDHMPERAAAFNALPAAIEVSYQISARDIVNEFCGGSMSVAGGGFFLRYERQTLEEKAVDDALLSEAQREAEAKIAREFEMNPDLRAWLYRRGAEPEPDPTDYDRVQDLPEDRRAGDLLENFVRGI